MQVHLWKTFSVTLERYKQVMIKLFICSSRHGCISDAALRRLIQRLRDILKRANLQISETSPGRFIKDVSSETSQRSLRFSQRRLWVASKTVILGLQTKVFFGYLFIYLRVFIFFGRVDWYRKLKFIYS